MSRSSGRRVTRGAILALGLSLLTSFPASAETSGTGDGGDPALRTLFIVLDAVPFDVVGEITDPALGEEAHFRDFKQPVPLISTFPSSTSVALGGILESIGLERSPGYEAHFFDWQERKVRGGGMMSYYKIEFGWREFFDWSRKGPVGSSFEAVRPVKYGLNRLEKGIADFVSNDRQVFYLYVAATDSAAHVQGPESLVRFLTKMEVLIAEARRADPTRPFEVIIFSDHGIAGGKPLKNIVKSVKTTLAEGGFRLSKRLRRESDLVLTPFGLVSNFEVYVAVEHEPRVAQLLVNVEGVDLCVRHEADRFVVESSLGRADLRRRELEGTLEWAYEVVSGDPIGYEPILERIPETERTDQVWVSDKAIFQATSASRYPDVPYRVARAFDLVDNPASVLCSLSEGYMYGPAQTDLLARFGKGRLEWTHGAMTGQETLGFFLTDAEDWQETQPVRFDRALDFFVRRYTERGESTLRPE